MASWMTAQIDLADYPDYQVQVQGEFGKINALARTPEEGHQKLRKIVGEQIEKLDIRDKKVAQHVIADYLGVYKMFQGPEDRVVEAWILIWAYRSDGAVAWHLKVIVDTDFPRPSEHILPHHGYEIYLDNVRKGGPGHIYFTEKGPGCWRTQSPKHEVKKGVYSDTGLGGVAGSSTPLWNELRLDWAIRLWAEGRDEETWQYCEGSWEAYKKEIEKPPLSWQRYAQDRPGFGLPRGGS